MKLFKVFLMFSLFVSVPSSLMCTNIKEKVLNGMDILTVLSLMPIVLGIKRVYDAKFANLDDLVSDFRDRMTKDTEDEVARGIVSESSHKFFYWGIGTFVSANVIKYLINKIN